MTASTIDRNTPREEGKTQAYPVAAATTILLGTHVALDASGYLVGATDSAALKYVGVAAEAVDNSAGAAAALDAKVYRDEVHHFAAAGLALTDVGKPMYLADNQTVQLAPTNMFVGILAYYYSATVAPVDIEPATRRSVSEDDDDSVELVGVAANKVITVNGQVALDADGYLVDSDDSTAVSFWGFALEAVDNTGGSDGDLDCPVQREGVKTQATTGAAATDVGKECWQATDSETVSTTPGAMLIGTVNKVRSATSVDVAFKRMPIVGQRVDRQRTIAFTRIAACGTGPVACFEDRQSARKMLPLAMHADCETAPGGAYVCTLTFTDGTKTFACTITGSATHGENQTPAAVADALSAATDFDVTASDDNASGATAGIKGEVTVEEL